MPTLACHGVLVWSLKHLRLDHLHANIIVNPNAFDQLCRLMMWTYRPWQWFQSERMPSQNVHAVFCFLPEIWTGHHFATITWKWTASHEHWQRQRSLCRLSYLPLQRLPDQNWSTATAWRSVADSDLKCRYGCYPCCASQLSSSFLAKIVKNPERFSHVHTKAEGQYCSPSRLT